MIYLITAVHNEIYLNNLNKNDLKSFLGLSRDFISIIVMDNFKLKNKKYLNNFDQVITTKKDLFFFGSILYGLKLINIKKGDRIIIYNTDSVKFSLNSKNQIDFNNKYSKEIVCGRFLNSENKQSYGAWKESKSLFSPKIHNNKVADFSNKNRDYICNSNLLNISADIILNVFTDGIEYKQTYLDFVISKMASRKNYNLKIIDIPITLERHDKQIKDKFLDIKSIYKGIESPFNPFTLGLKIRAKYFKRTLPSFIFYRLFLHLKNYFLNICLRRFINLLRLLKSIININDNDRKS